MVQLIKKSCKHDENAFVELMQNYEQYMYKTAKAILTDDEDVADAVSDTILSCWEKIITLKKPEFFKTWTTRILINKCNDILRKRKRSFPMDEVPETGIREIRYDDLEWDTLLGCLEEKYRLIIVLYYVDEFKTAEIAQLLKIPESTVCSRGRKKLAELYDDTRLGGIANG